MLLGNLIWKITGDTRDFDKSIKGTETKMSGLAKTAGGLSKFLPAAFAGLSLAAAVNFGKKIVGLASDFEETENKFRVVFSSLESQAQVAAQSLEDNFGLSSLAARQLLSDTGDLLTGFGFTQNSALDLSKQVNELAVDLASFTNFSGGAEGASAALTKALLGETESLKSLGIAISQADIERLARQRGITGEIDRQTKAVLTLELAISQSKNAIGDFARSQDSFANQSRIAQAEIQNLSANLGTLLLPAATVAVSIFGQFAGKINEVVEGYNRMRDAENAVSKGTATTNQELLILEEQLALVNRELDAFLFEEGGAQDALVKETQARADALRSEISQLSLKLAAEERINGYKAQASKDEEAREQKRKEAADAEIQRQKALATEIDLQIQGRKEAEEEYGATLEEISFKRENGLISENEAQSQTIAAIEQHIEALMLLGYAMDSEVGTVGQNTLFSLIEKWKELNGTVEETGQLAFSFKEVYSGAIRSVLSSIGDLTKKIYEGEDALKTFGKTGLQVTSAILRSIGDELAGYAAISLAQILTATPLGVTYALAGAAAAYAASGVVAGLAGQFAGGGIVPGKSYRGDNMIAQVDSGEMILNDRQQAKLWSMLNGSGGGGNTFIFEVDSVEMARVVAKPIEDGIVRFKVK